MFNHTVERAPGSPGMDRSGIVADVWRRRFGRNFAVHPCAGDARAGGECALGRSGSCGGGAQERGAARVGAGRGAGRGAAEW